MRGKIVKGIAGLYYVRCSDGKLYECRARGVFRRDNRKPLVGDTVETDVIDPCKYLGNIVDLLPRHSELIRPAVANVDQALVIFACVKPQPNFNLLDRFLIMMERQGTPCAVCFNKSDIDEKREGERYAQIYRDCGYETLSVSAKTGEGIEALQALLKGRTTVAAGPSGVGKSSVINCLQSDVVMETGEISAKIERGKHTTRHSELITVGEDTYIFDTPGFSSLGLFDLEKEELAACYPEFSEHRKRCRFDDCAHMNEQSCGVKEAVAKGEISELRYGNYRLLYEELEGVRIKKNDKGCAENFGRFGRIR